MLALESERSGCANDDFGRCLRPFHGFQCSPPGCYLQQIYKIARDTTGVRAISYPTWILWTAVNSSTAIDALTHPGDITLAWIHGLNALCCTIVIALTALKQRQYHAQIGQIPPGYPNAFDYARPANDMVRPEPISLCR
jgi:hypothetical protein